MLAAPVHSTLLWLYWQDPDDDLYEEDEAPPPRAQPRRRPRRQHHSDTRIAGLMGGGESGGGEPALGRGRNRSMRRHRSLGALPPSIETSDQTESSPEREAPRRAGQFLRRTFGGFEEGDEDFESPRPVGIGMAPALTFPLTRRAPVRPPVR